MHSNNDIRSIMRFSHNKKDGICTAYIIKSDAYDFITTDISGEPWRDYENNYFAISSIVRKIIRSNITAFAYCNLEEDEYVDEIGESIAAERLISEYKNAEIKVLKKYIDYLSKLTAKNIDALDRLNSYMEKRSEDKRRVIDKFYKTDDESDVSDTDSSEIPEEAFENIEDI